MPDKTAQFQTARLRQLFQEEVLLDPREGNGNTVDLMRAVASHGGAANMHLSPEARAIKDLLSDSKSVVLVLIDGLGMNLLQRLEPAGFFHSCGRRELRALAPSTTACVLTALATGAYPAEHAITGWFTHLPEFGRTCIPLPFTDRATDESLLTYGIEPEKVFPCPSMLSRLKTDVLSLLPDAYWNSPYARYWRGGTTGEGYSSLPEATDKVAQNILNRENGTFTYLYIPLVDEVSHHFGPGSEEALAAAKAVEREIERLADTLPAGTRLICTADHGQIHILNESRHLLLDGDPLLDLLQAPPSGEDRFPLFHLKPETRETFCQLFQERYSEHFLLLSMDEMESMRIFGPGPLSAPARRRFGDFAAIATGPWVLGYSQPSKDPAFHHLGRHGGLSPDEMRVPLLWR